MCFNFFETNHITRFEASVRHISTSQIKKKNKRQSINRSHDDFNDVTTLKYDIFLKKLSMLELFL